MAPRRRSLDVVHYSINYSSLLETLHLTIDTTFTHLGTETNRHRRHGLSGVSLPAGASS